MSKLIRRTKKQVGSALIVALQLTALSIISLMLPLSGGPQQSANAPADSQMRAAPQTQTAQPPTASELAARRASAVRAIKLYEPRATQVFNLGITRAEAAERLAQQSAQHGAQHSAQEGEEEGGPTLTTDHEDYPPFSYVYINGTGFEPGETVNMIVVELSPNPAAFEPWDVVADENGNISTSWYIFSEEFIGATLQVTATGQTSGLTASAIFTDARNWDLFFVGTGSGSVTITPDSGTINAPVSCGGTGTNALSQTVTGNCSPNITTSANGATITFVATANGGSTFAGWSLPSNWASLTCTGTTNPCSGIITAGNAALTVTFNSASPTPTPTSTATATATATATSTPTSTATATATATSTPTPTPTCCIPTIGGQGGSTTVECPTAPSFTAPTASDSCGGATVVSDGDTTAAGSCANSYTSTRAWHAVNSCGNTSSQVSQTVTVADTTAPTIGNAGSDATVECPTTPTFTAPTASDACGGSTVNFLGETTTAGTCANNYTAARSWNAVDACGNTSVTRTQTVTVRDTAAPAIGGQGGNATIECPATPSFTAPTASDACGGSTVVEDSDTTAAGSCANSYSATKMWHAVDACGNTSSPVSQTITVVDTTAPTIGSAGGNATIECPTLPSFTAPTASDACGGSTVVMDGDTTAAGSCANSYSTTRTWHAVDACGNTSASRSQTVTVADTTAPTIGSAGGNATIECPSTPSFTAPTASDACGGSTVVNDGDTTAAGSCTNSYSTTRTWHAVDACGNTSASRSQTVTVADTTAPMIGGQGSDGTIECPATPSFTAPTASDACGGSTVIEDSDTTATGTCAGTYSATKTWHAVDACGNTSAQVSQTVTVEDTTAPMIGGQGSDGTIECPATPSFTAPTASDACGGSTVVNDGDMTAAGSCANSYSTTRTWHAVDACGNTSASRSQTITVEDTAAPTIGGQGSDATIECPMTPSFTAPTASDACGGSTVIEDSDSTAAGACVGTYSETKTWHAVDACGNTSAQVSQTVTVEDTTAPAIGGQGSDGTIECPATPSFTAPTASDACGGSTVVEESDTTAAGACVGTYSETKTWHAVDACGNTSAQVSQTITVVDTTAPTIGGQGSDGTIECPATPSFTAPTASDACGGSTVVEESDTTAAGTCVGTYSETKTWHAVDACGNTSAQVSQTITLEDTTAPTIGTAGANGTIQCPATPSFTAPTASDTCSGASVQDLGDSTMAGTCANSYTSTKSWRAVDGCGNTSGTVSQTITVEDTTAPTIGSAGANAIIQCPMTPSFTAPTASDACGGSTVVEDSDTSAAGTCAGTYSQTKTWHAVDACGNTSASRTQTITVVDTTAPAIGGQGGNATIECPASPSFTAPTASDACGGSTVIEDSDTTAAGTCANNYSRTKRWHAVDACGNTSGQVSQMITVRDTTAPAVGSPGADATIACDATPVFTAPTASDACGGATVQQVSDTTTASAPNVLYTRCWRAVDACGNTSGTVCQTITRLGNTITGFYQPVDMNGPTVPNVVKGGSTVPLKFNIYCNNVEKTSVSDVMYGSARVIEYSCGGTSGVPMDDVPNTGATALRYDGHQFIQNWQTPKGANKCYAVRITAADGGAYIEAYFKTK